MPTKQHYYVKPGGAEGMADRHTTQYFGSKSPTIPQLTVWVWDYCRGWVWEGVFGLDKTQQLSICSEFSCQQKWNLPTLSGNRSCVQWVCTGFRHSRSGIQQSSSQDDTWVNMSHWEWGDRRGSNKICYSWKDCRCAIPYRIVTSVQNADKSIWWFTALLIPTKGQQSAFKGCKKKKKKKRVDDQTPPPRGVGSWVTVLCCVLITYLSVTAAVNHLLIYHCLWSSILSVTIMNTTSLSGTYNECNRVRFGSCVVQGIMLSLPLHSYH